ncbi:glycosyltransferase [Vibrio sp. RE86]|uniref:glycosyltransferase n=1 Tax=Vibrio sp. RE86 TaxID=2607605 RepID=UPI001493474E|nr:glycosyltransferase [Vibrio sp. RE86]NOH79697.1 glycosyltransferase [Vibrio sp. RE86]
MAKRILFVHYGDDWIRGSEKCLLDLVNNLDRQHFTPIVWTNNEALKTELEQSYVTCHQDSFPLLLGWHAPKFDLFAWKSLVTAACAMIDKHRIDLIHVNSGAPCQWMLIAARMKKIPLVTQLHCTYPARERLSYGLNLAPHVIAVSRHVAQNITDDGFPSEKLTVIHNGINTEILEKQVPRNVHQELNIPEDHFIFATVGSLIARKGVDRILTALRHVTLEYPNTHLVVIGDGPLRATLEQQSEYQHLQDHVHFVGEQRNVLGWLKGCNAFISGARSEAFGLAVAEAALAKLPVVAPFEGGIPEFISHGKTGVLFPNHGVAPMAKAMRIVINNPKIAQTLGEKAYHYIIKHHSVAVSCKKIERVYRQLLTEPKSQPRSVVNLFSPVKTFVINRLSTGGQHG